MYVLHFPYYINRRFPILSQEVVLNFYNILFLCLNYKPKQVRKYRHSSTFSMPLLCYFRQILNSVTIIGTLRQSAKNASTGNAPYSILHSIQYTLSPYLRHLQSITADMSEAATIDLARSFLSETFSSDSIFKPQRR